MKRRRTFNERPRSLYSLAQQPRTRKKPKKQHRWKAGQLKCDVEACCRRCGSWHSLHPHHIVHRGTPWLGDDDERNCCPLCADCHRLWHDHKGFDLWPLLRDDEKAHAIEQLGEARARTLLVPSESPKLLARRYTAERAA